MTSGYIASNGLDTDIIFAFYSSGTKPALTGYKHSNGSDFRDVYQPGNSGLTTGYKIASGADIGSIFTTPSTSLPINGRTFTATVHIAGTTNSCGLQFITNNSTWSVVDMFGGTGGTPVTLTSGSVPSGSTSVLMSVTVTGDTPSTDINPAPTATALTGSNLTLQTSNAVTGTTSPSKSTSCAINVQFKNSSGTTISNTSFTFSISCPHP